MPIRRRTVALLITSALCLALLLPSIVGAQATPLPGEIGSQFGAAARGAGVEQQVREGEGPPIVAFTYKIIKAALSIIGVLLVVLLVYAGYLWMTAGGEEEKITKAKQIIRNAIIGVAIVLAAYAISAFVVNRLLYAAGGQITVP